MWLSWRHAFCLHLSKLTPLLVDKYVKTYWDSFKYSEELSLGLIFYHGSNGHTSFTDLGTALPDPVPWTVKEITLFEAAFQYDGKDFERIHKLVRCLSKFHES